MANGDRGNLQLLGVGASNGYLHLTNWQEYGNGVWHAGGLLPGQGRAFREVVLGRGVINDGR